MLLVCRYFNRIFVQCTFSVVVYRKTEKKYNLFLFVLFVFLFFEFSGFYRVSLKKGKPKFSGTLLNN